MAARVHKPTMTGLMVYTQKEGFTIGDGKSHAFLWALFNVHLFAWALFPLNGSKKTIHGWTLMAIDNII
jgi:hypothetical protein